MQFRSDHMLPASAHFRPTTIAIFFVLLMAVASVPIATHPLPPLSDYVNHLARTHVIDAIATDPNLARYYTVEWQIIPNLMIDLIVPVLHRFMSVYLAGQIFTIAAFALIAIAMQTQIKVSQGPRLTILRRNNTSRATNAGTRGMSSSTSASTASSTRCSTASCSTPTRTRSASCC